jgi:putative acetyltransferase
MEPIIIRRAAFDDAEAIADCHKEAVEKKAAGFYPADVIAEWSHNGIEKIRGQIQNEGFIFLVASLDGSVLGYGVAIPLVFELKGLCTKPNKKGRVGTLLLAALLDECKKRGCDRLDLSSSLNAEKFYLEHGFRALERGQHKMESGLAMDCIKMRIALDS